MHIYSRFAASIAAAAVLTPALAAADTVSDLQAQIQSLLSQLHALQQQLVSAQASSTGATIPAALPQGERGMPRCVPLMRNIGLGTQGDDVMRLQDMLREDGDFGFTASSTGFFGPMTARAMARFQMQMGIASSTDGSVGPLTRSFFSRACGQPGDSRREEEAHMMMGSTTPRMPLPMNATGTPWQRPERPDMGGMMNGAMGRVLANIIVGSVTANTGNAITITGPDGTARTVNITASTTIEVFSSANTSAVAGTAASAQIGMVAQADGAPASDGSLDARHIRVAPAGMTLPMPRMGGQEGGMRLDDLMERARAFMGGQTPATQQ